MVAGGEQTEAEAHETREFTTKVHILATGWLLWCLLPLCTCEGYLLKASVGATFEIPFHSVGSLWPASDRVGRILCSTVEWI